MSSKLYLLLKVRNSDQANALEKLLLHLKVINKIGYSQYGLNSYAKVLPEEILFYIGPNEKNNARSGIVYKARMIDCKMKGKRFPWHKTSEIPELFRSNIHKVYLKITDLNEIQANVMDYVSCKSGLSIPDIRSGLATIRKR